MTAQRSTVSEATEAPEDELRASPESGRLAITWVRGHGLRTLPHLLVLAAIVGVWHFLVVVAEVVPSILVPEPFGVGESFVQQVLSVIQGGHVRNDFVATVAESWIGFGICIVLGIALGLLINEVKLARRFLMPYVILFNATPRIAFAPIFLIWFGFGWSPKIVMAVAVATFPVLIGTLAGLQAADPDLIRLMRAYGATDWQVFTKARVYAALPYIVAGAKTASVFAVVGAVVGEFSGGNEGLGYLILVAQESLNMAQAFATLLLLSLTGLALYVAVTIAGTRLVYWSEEDATELVVA